MSVFRSALITLVLLPPSVHAAIGGDEADAVKAASGVQDPMAVDSLIQLTLGMAAVLAVIVGVAWLMKRSGRFQMGAGGGLRVLGGLSMGTRERVVLLQVGDTQLLVGVAPGRVQTLHVLDTPLATGQAETPAVAAGFAGQLGRLMKGGGR